MQETMVDHNRLEKVLGVGTVGTVYLATDTKTGEQVALKMLHSDVSRDDTIRSRFRREISILQKLSHPNIVRCLSSGSHDDQLYFTMEVLDGQPLKKILTQQGRLSWQEAVECGWQVCSALQHAHNIGIIHRDLKPANLFIDKDGRLKLCDFGIARDLTDTHLTDHGLTVGTYHYMSPEQIRGDSSLTAKTDLYALGCLLFKMLTGSEPFTGTSLPQIFDQHLQLRPPHVKTISPDCPDQLDALVAQLLEKDPDKRPFNARAVQGVLAEVLMKWAEDEDAAMAKKYRQPDMWAIDSRKPILGSLVRRQLAQEQPSIGWGTIVSIAVLIFGFIALAWRLANESPGQ